MKTAIASLLSTGIETAPLPSAKVKDVSGDQFTGKLAEMLSGGGPRPVTQDSKAISIGAKGQVIPPADSIVESHPQGSIGSYSQDMEGQGDGSIPPWQPQMEPAKADAVERPTTHVRPAPGAEMRVDCLPSSATTNEIDSNVTQSPRPPDLQKSEEKSNRSEKSDLKSHRSNGESRGAKKVAGKEQDIDAQPAVQTTLSDSELPGGSVRGSCIVVPVVERSDLKQSNGEVIAPGHVQEKPFKAPSVAASSKPVSSGERKESNKSAQVSNAAQEQSGASASKEPAEARRLSSQGNVEKKEAVNNGNTAATVAHRSEQAAIQWTGTMQVQTASAVTHSGSIAAGDLAGSERRTTAELVSNGTTTNNQPHILKATPNTLEVGVANGTHGWVKVRAEMTNDGRVNASLSSSSPTAQQMLRHELPSLTTFLRAENVQVGSLTVQASASTSERGGLPGSGAGPDQGNQSLGGGQSGDQRGGNVPDLPDNGVGPVFSGAEMAAEETGSDWMYASGGSWLNVMA